MENFRILKEKENFLFKRKEIEASVESKVPPKREDIKSLISEKLSVPKENIKVKKIYGKFGSKTFIITANIYSSREDKDSVEPEKKNQESGGKVPPEERITKEEKKEAEAEKQELAQPEKEPKEKPGE